MLRNLQALVENKRKIEQSLHSLATAIKNKLQKKVENLLEMPTEEVPASATLALAK